MGNMKDIRPLLPLSPKDLFLKKNLRSACTEDLMNRNTKSSNGCS